MNWKYEKFPKFQKKKLTVAHEVTDESDAYDYDHENDKIKIELFLLFDDENLLFKGDTV